MPEWTALMDASLKGEGMTQAVIYFSQARCIHLFIYFIFYTFLQEKLNFLQILFWYEFHMKRMDTH